MSLLEAKEFFDAGGNLNIEDLHLCLNVVSPDIKERVIGVYYDSLFVYESESINTELVNYLMSYGWDINKRYKDIYYSESEEATPLEQACEHRNLDVIKVLVECGADINNTTTFNLCELVCLGSHHNDVFKVEEWVEICMYLQSVGCDKPDKEKLAKYNDFFSGTMYEGSIVF